MPRPPKSKHIEVPKISPSPGGVQPNSGRKTGIPVSAEDYQLYTAARAKKTAHEARLAEFEERQKAGELIEVDVVRTEWQKILGNVRAKLLGLPTKLAAQAMGCASINEMEALLAEGVHEALQELANDAR